MIDLQQPKAQVIIPNFGKQHVIKEADGKSRLQLQIVLPFVELLLVQLGPIIKDALLIIAKRQDLHLNVELPAGLITGFDIEDRELVVKYLLGIEGVEQVNVADLVALAGIQDGVQ